MISFYFILVFSFIFLKLLKAIGSESIEGVMEGLWNVIVQSQDPDSTDSKIYACIRCSQMIEDTAHSLLVWGGPDAEGICFPPSFEDHSEPLFWLFVFLNLSDSWLSFGYCSQGVCSYPQDGHELIKNIKHK